MIHGNAGRKDMMSCEKESDVECGGSPAFRMSSQRK